MDFKDRILELRRVPAQELVPHPLNWRQHPERQRAAVSAFLRRIGIADRLLGRLLPDGRIQLLDGHLRRSEHPEVLWPVLITDLTDAEATEFLLMLHTLPTMAVPDQDALDALVDVVSFEDDALQAIVEEIGVGLNSIDDWNTAHQYGIDSSPDRACLKLVIAIQHHAVVEEAIEAARRALHCDRGHAIMEICQRAFQDFA